MDKAEQKNNKRRPVREKEHDDFEQRIIDLRRVTRVMAGGKRLRFRACVVIGDHQNKIGYGVAKGKDVSLAVNKAVTQAKKSLLIVPIVDGTIPHSVVVKYGAVQVMLRPAPLGTGIIAGGAVRSVLELSGIKNVSAKILNSNNKVNNVKAVFKVLGEMKFRPAKDESTVETKIRGQKEKKSSTESPVDQKKTSETKK
jgi:small subunit ribosomal protein S5